MKPIMTALLVLGTLLAKANFNESLVAMDSISIDSVNILDVACKGTASGAIEVMVSGGQEPYAYLWSNGEGTSTVDSLVAGEYLLTISDAVNEIKTMAFVIEEPADSLKISTSYNEIDCIGWYEVWFSSSGGGNYHHYSFSKDPLEEDFSQQPVYVANSTGTYYCKVKDASGCIAVDTLQVIPICNFDGIVSVRNESFAGSNDGSISVQVVGCTSNGEAEFWLSPYNNAPNGQSRFFNNLSAGTYSLYAASGSCSFSRMNIVVGIEFPGMHSQLVSKTNIDCNHDYGEVELNIVGGVAPYDIQWGHGAEGAFVDSLNAGMYSYTVTDQEELTLVDTVEVLAKPIFPDDIILKNECPYNQLPQQASSAVVAENEIFDVLWLDELGETISDVDTMNVEVTGGEIIYVTIADSDSGCLYSDSLNVIIENDDIELFTNEFLSINHQDCANELGEIVNWPTGGLAPYEVKWSNGTNTIFNDSLVAGIYTVEVIDSLGCSVRDTAEVFGRPMPNIDATLAGGECATSPDSVSLTLAISPAYDFISYTWSDQAGSVYQDESLENFTVDQPTWFYASIYDSLSSCEYLDSVQVHPNEFYTYDPVVSDPVIISSNGAGNGAIDPMLTGGVLPYAYNWNLGSVDSTLESISAGFYQLIVQDGLGCQTIFSYEVDELTAVNEIHQDVSISPNPAEDELKIDAPFDFVALIDLNGKVVLQSKLRNDQVTISLPKLPNGVYVLRLISEEGSIMMSEIVVLQD